MCCFSASASRLFMCWCGQSISCSNSSVHRSRRLWWKECNIDMNNAIYDTSRCDKWCTRIYATEQSRVEMPAESSNRVVWLPSTQLHLAAFVWQKNIAWIRTGQPDKSLVRKSASMPGKWLSYSGFFLGANSDDGRITIDAVVSSHAFFAAGIASKRICPWVVLRLILFGEDNIRWREQRT